MELLGGVYSLVKVLAMPLSEDRGGGRGGADHVDVIWWL